MTLNIDEIVEEVIRRLKIYLSEKRILIILRDGSDFEELSILVALLKEKGYTFHLLSLLTKDLKVLEQPEFGEMLQIRSSIFREEEYEHFMRSYESLMVSDLTMLEVQAYHELYFSETLGKLIFHTIKENKPVYGLSKEMRDVKNRYLNEKMNEIREELRKLKIHILTDKVNIGAGKGTIEASDQGSSHIRKTGSEEKGMGEIEPKGMNQKETGDQSREREKRRKERETFYEGEVLREKFITLSDVMSVRGLNEKETIKIGSQSRLTMEASDYLNRAGISLLRVEE